jgi:hypothetical protein
LVWVAVALVCVVIHSLPVVVVVVVVVVSL